MRILGKEASQLAAYQRDVNTVFQDYALFPHMTVLENVAYGLMVKGVGKKERQTKRDGIARASGAWFCRARKPSHLSGGQRQRVALARALVNQPSVLLLDEPLGALDLKLREQMQGELKKLQRELGITFIFVTHDQSEALSMSDRVAVFNNGRIEQVDTPRELYMNPRTAFVAQFCRYGKRPDRRLSPAKSPVSRQPFSSPGTHPPQRRSRWQTARRNAGQRHHQRHPFSGRGDTLRTGT